MPRTVYTHQPCLFPSPGFFYHSILSELISFQRVCHKNCHNECEKKQYEILLLTQSEQRSSVLPENPIQWWWQINIHDINDQIDESLCRLEYNIEVKIKPHLDLPFQQKLQYNVTSNIYRSQTPTMAEHIKHCFSFQKVDFKRPSSHFSLERNFENESILK